MSRQRSQLSRFSLLRQEVVLSRQSFPFVAFAFVATIFLPFLPLSIVATLLRQPALPDLEVSAVALFLALFVVFSCFSASFF